MYSKTIVNMKNHGQKKINSPRVQTTRLASFGPVIVVPALPMTYLVEYNIVHYKTLVSIEIKHERKKKHVLMAQTTRDASFGPVIVIVASHIPFRP